MLCESRKYNHICNKSMNLGVPLMIIALLFSIFLFDVKKYILNPKSTEKIVLCDTAQNTTKYYQQYNEHNPLVVYGNLLKDIDSVQEKKNEITISIKDLDKKIGELQLKNHTVCGTIDSTSKHRFDSVYFLADTIKYNEKKISIELEIDELERKKSNDTKKEEEIDDKLKELTKKSLILKPNVQKEGKNIIDSIVSKQNGQGSFDFKGIKYHVCVVDIKDSQHDINFHLKNKEGVKYNSIYSLLHDKDLDSLNFLMITNGGMYTPNQDPQGLFIEDGKIIKPLDESKLNNSTNFYLFPNGVFYIDSNRNANIKTTTEYSKLSKSLHVRHATQSGPMLVIDNKIHDKFAQGSKNINIRSGVGILNDKYVIFIISKGLVNFWDFATVFKDVFGCRNALYLDGAISLMYLNKINTKDLGGNFGPIISITKNKN